MKLPRLPDILARAKRDDESARYQVDLNRYLAEKEREPLVQSGSWTPTLVSFSGTNPTVNYNAGNRGRWAKVGTMVTVTGRLDVSSVSGGTGTAAIGGLPFACSADQGARGGLTFTWAQGFSSTATPVSALVSPSDRIAAIQRRASADARDALNVQTLVSECASPLLIFHGSYDAG